jgi:hypothetical protein
MLKEIPNFFNNNNANNSVRGETLLKEEKIK